MEPAIKGPQAGLDERGTDGSSFSGKEFVPLQTQTNREL
jgi:hypothetical protein